MADNNQSKEKAEEKQKTILATQRIVGVADIRDNLMVMNSGDLRAVLKVSGVNFDLFDQKDQEQTIYAFQTFLNSLDFPIQILVQSRPVNLDPYLQKLKDLSLKQPTEALRVETYEYMEFIEQLSRLGTIMDKNFYVILSFSPTPTTPKGILEKLQFSFVGTPKQVILQHFEEAKKKLFERIQVVAGGLGGAGLEAIQLTTPELIELLFSCYNPNSPVYNGAILEEFEHLFTTTNPNPSPTAEEQAK
jgi:type IV secretory pathway VirB4 component